MKKYNSGDVVDIAFPYEESSDEKVRPALVIKDDGEYLLLLKITSQHKGLKWDVDIPADEFSGLVKPSVIQVNRYMKVSKSKLTTVIPRGAINPMQLAIVKQRLQEYLKHCKKWKHKG